MKDESDPTRNGIYTVTFQGNGSNPFVLTRGNYSSIAANMASGSHVYVNQGTVNNGKTFVQIGTGSIIFGTTGLTYREAWEATQPGAEGQVLTWIGQHRVWRDPQCISYLSQLFDVSISGITINQGLYWDGVRFVNRNTPAPMATNGPFFFLDNAQQIGTNSQNVIRVATLTKNPTGGSQVVDAMACNNNTVVDQAFLYGQIGGSNIEAGEWTFGTYASVTSTGGGKTNSITRNLYRARVQTGTITVTGTGTTRTVTASTGTPFANSDASTDITLCSYIQTAAGIYPIVGYTSSTVVTIACPSTLTNATGSYSMWQKFVGINTGDISSTGTNYALYTNRVVVPANISLIASDQLGEIVFATSNDVDTINIVHNGTSYYSFFKSPLFQRHNDLAGLQGGTSGEYYHLNSAQYTNINQTPANTILGNNTGSAASVAALTPAQVKTLLGAYGTSDVSFGSYSQWRNNTGSTAAPTAQTYHDYGWLTYTPGTTGTETWDGTAPTGGTIKYRVIIDNKKVDIILLATYTGAGATNTKVSYTLPPEAPAPDEQAGFGAANDMIYPGDGGFGSASTTVTNNNKAGINEDGVGNDAVWLIGAQGNSAAGKYVWIHVTYFTP